MSDSCKLRKLDPGTAATYSKPRDLRTSTMKSEPGRSVVRTSTPEGASPPAGGMHALPGPDLARQKVARRLLLCWRRVWPCRRRLRPAETCVDQRRTD